MNSEPAIGAVIKADVDAGSSIAFFVFLAILGFEYLGLDNWGPLVVLKVLKVPLLFSLFLFFYSWSKYGLKRLWEFWAFRLLIIFTLLTIGALIHGLIQARALEPAKQQVGYLALAVAGAYLLNSRERIRLFAGWIVVLNVCLVLMNWDKLGSAVRVGGFTAGYFAGDGNDLGWSLVIAAPMALLLFSSKTKFSSRLVWGACFLIIATGIVGTQSRGASLAAGLSFLYLFMVVAKRKSVGVVAIGILSVVVLVVAPTQYFDRMSTVANYEEDTSATNRIRAWRRATEMATDNPILGVGAGSFNSAYGRHYRDVESGDAQRWISPHSIYFKVLGEYGFIGVAVFTAILISLWRVNKRTAAALRGTLGDNDWLARWPLYINASLVAYAAAGIFLGGVDYPHRFLLMAATLSASLASNAWIYQVEKPSVVV